MAAFYWYLLRLQLGTRQLGVVIWLYKYYIIGLYSLSLSGAYSLVLRHYLRLYIIVISTALSVALAECINCQWITEGDAIFEYMLREIYTDTCLKLEVKIYNLLLKQTKKLYGEFLSIFKKYILTFSAYATKFYGRVNEIVSEVMVKVKKEKKKLYWMKYWEIYV